LSSTDKNTRQLLTFRSLMEHVFTKLSRHSRDLGSFGEDRKHEHN
jgi:hypothetical protein